MAATMDPSDGDNKPWDIGYNYLYSTKLYCESCGGTATALDVFALRRTRACFEIRKSGESLARAAADGQSGVRESGSFQDDPAFLEARGENAADRGALGAKRLRELPRCQFHLLSARALPRDLPAAVRVLRRGAKRMRQIRDESVLQLEQLLSRFRARAGELPLRSVISARAPGSAEIVVQGHGAPTRRSGIRRPRRDRGHDGYVEVRRAA